MKLENSEIRKQLKGLRQASRSDIFSPVTTSPKWAFHHGGRKELQFNIGIEDPNPNELRYGVAFSLEPSQTLPNIEVLFPNVKLFNDFIQLYAEEYADMKMWHWEKDRRSDDYRPTIIPPERMHKGNFTFLGKRQNLERLDYEFLLRDLDRLLPLYKYVESNGNVQPILSIEATPFKFHPGGVSKVASTVASRAEEELEINLRHNKLQEALHQRLSKKYGAENAGDEQQSGVGTSVDVVVRNEGNYWFYEIKTALSPRACIRQALGQLLEYAFWPGAQEATRLIIVGETALDEDAAKYLHTLRERFSLPIDYEQIIAKRTR